ncbi:hypothetical protein J2S94_003526 [Arthrobacter bambusae]|nr:hypothetical protein [Arthrobacter bambusae]
MSPSASGNSSLNAKNFAELDSGMANGTFVVRPGDDVDYIDCVR